MEQKEKTNTLKPTLGLWDATAINVGAIIGGGIFVVTGIVARLAGSAMIISMLIAAAISIFTALSTVELMAWQPVEGSFYEYAHQLISPFSGFLTGWMWMLSNLFSGAAVSLGFAYYLNIALPNIPSNAIAAIICLAFTTLNFVGIRQSAILNNILVAIKLAALSFFVAFGALHITTSNFLPFTPLSSGALYGAAFIFFAYGGFARAAVVAEEVKDAKRTVPRAILLSLAISTIVYLLVGIVALGLVGSVRLGASNSPLTQAMASTGNNYAVQVILVGGLVATASVLLTSILGVSRMAYSMARREDMPKKLSLLHQKFNTPYYSIWIFGLIMTVLVLFVDLARVVALSTFALLFYYLIANVAALKLKIPNRKYPKLVPILGLATCLILLVFILFAAVQAWIIGVACLIAGTLYYAVKNRLNRRTRKGE
jgi:APA family basic amino acid/polyamine antiporter